ncbi:hypothetical protein ACOMHN_000977 [Nucella lapillus]
MATSKSLNNLPLVTVTEAEDNCTDHHQHDHQTGDLCEHFLDDLPVHPRSHPGSPQLKRKAFTTFVGGMRYIIVGMTWYLWYMGSWNDLWYLWYMGSWNDLWYLWYMGSWNDLWYLWYMGSWNDLWYLWYMGSWNDLWYLWYMGS